MDDVSGCQPLKPAGVDVIEEPADDIPAEEGDGSEQDSDLDRGGNGRRVAPEGEKKVVRCGGDGEADEGAGDGLPGGMVAGLALGKGSPEEGDFLLEGKDVGFGERVDVHG